MTAGEAGSSYEEVDQRVSRANQLSSGRLKKRIQTLLRITKGIELKEIQTYYIHTLNLQDSMSESKREKKCERRTTKTGRAGT